MLLRENCLPFPIETVICINYMGPGRLLSCVELDFRVRIFSFLIILSAMKKRQRKELLSWDFPLLPAANMNGLALSLKAWKQFARLPWASKRQAVEREGCLSSCHLWKTAPHLHSLQQSVNLDAQGHLKLRDAVGSLHSNLFLISSFQILIFCFLSESLKSHWGHSSRWVTLFSSSSSNLWSFHQPWYTQSTYFGRDCCCRLCNAVLCMSAHE